MRGIDDIRTHHQAVEEAARGDDRPIVAVIGLVRPIELMVATDEVATGRPVAVDDLQERC